MITRLSPELADEIMQPLFDAQIAPSDVEPWIEASLEAGLIDESFDASAILTSSR